MKKLLPHNPFLRGGTRIILLLSLVPFLLGLGGGNGSTEDGATLPLPQKNFSVTLMDNTGLVTGTSRMTWEGKNYLKGQYGEATITIPFEKIQVVKFLPEDGANPTLIQAQVQLTSGKTYPLSIDRTTKVYAETDFGQLEIFVQDLQQMEFQ